VKVSEDEFVYFLNNEIPNILNMTKDFEVLLKLNDATLVKRKYYEGIEKLLEDAKRKHVSFIFILINNFSKTYSKILCLGGPGF
jgi:hypothetical protein